MLVRAAAGRGSSPHASSSLHGSPSPREYLTTCNLRQANPVLKRTVGWSLDYDNIALADSRGEHRALPQSFCCCSCCRQCFCESRISFRATKMLEWMKNAREVASAYAATAPLQNLTRAQWAAQQEAEAVLEELANLVPLVKILPLKVDGGTENSLPISPEAKRFVHDRVLKGSAYACLLLTKALYCRAHDTPQGKVYRKLTQQPERLQAAITALQREVAKGVRGSVKLVLAEKLKEQETYSTEALEQAVAIFEASPEYADWKHAEDLMAQLNARFDLKQLYFAAKTALNSSPTSSSGKDFEFFAHSNGERAMIRVLQRNGDGITLHDMKLALEKLEQWRTRQLNQTLSSPSSLLDKDNFFASSTSSTSSFAGAMKDSMQESNEKVSDITLSLAQPEENALRANIKIVTVKTRENAASSSPLENNNQASSKSDVETNYLPISLEPDETPLSSEQTTTATTTATRERKHQSRKNQSSELRERDIVSPELFRSQAESIFHSLPDLISSLDMEADSVSDAASWGWFRFCQAAERACTDSEWAAWVQVCGALLQLPVWRIASNYAIEYEAWRDTRLNLQEVAAKEPDQNTAAGEEESKTTRKTNEACYVCGGQGHFGNACIKQKEEVELSEEEEAKRQARKERKLQEKEAKQKRRDQSHRLIANGEVDLFLYNAAASDYKGGVSPKVLIWGEMKLNVGDLPKADHQRTEFVRKVLLAAQLRETSSHSSSSSRFAPPPTRPHPRVFLSSALSLFTEPDCRHRCMFFCLLPNPAADFALPSFLSAKVQESLWLPSALHLCPPGADSEEVRSIAGSLSRSIVKKELAHPLTVTEPYLVSGLEDNLVFFFYTEEKENNIPDPSRVQNTSKQGWTKH